jgi:prenyltransferase beta subunit
MEQTSASAYPNVLVLEYLKSSGQVGPNGKMAAAEKTAKDFVSQGYQQLVRFQTGSGGFNWWGDAQAPNVVLTAMGLQEFHHMSRVREVDQRILEKARRYLQTTQREDGSWKATQELHGFNMSLGSSDLIATAYVAWSLMEAGETGPHVDKAIRYIESHLAQASEDPYTMALAANALALKDPHGTMTVKVLADLAARKKSDAKGSFIPTKAQTVTFSTGDAATVETTALAASAFLIAGSHAPMTSDMFKWLQSQKQRDGSFGSTQATILSLRALILSAGAKKQEGSAMVAVKVNGKPAGTLKITPEDFDVTQVLDLKAFTHGGDNKVELAVKGESGAQVQIAATHFEPWPQKSAPENSPLAIAVNYDKVKAKVGERIGVTAEVRYDGKQPTFMVLAEMGLPPGMTVDGEALDLLAQRGQIARWRESGGKLLVFLNDVKPGDKHVFKYGLLPRMPVKATAPDSVVFEYYTPEHRAVAKPSSLEVG